MFHENWFHVKKFELVILTEFALFYEKLRSHFIVWIHGFTRNLNFFLDFFRIIQRVLWKLVKIKIYTTFFLGDFKSWFLQQYCKNQFSFGSPTSTIWTIFMNLLMCIVVHERISKHAENIRFIVELRQKNNAFTKQAFATSVQWTKSKQLLTKISILKNFDFPNLPKLSILRLKKINI